jgi:hypothetical protein
VTRYCTLFQSHEQRIFGSPMGLGPQASSIREPEGPILFS